MLPGRVRRSRRSHGWTLTALFIGGVLVGGLAPPAAAAPLTVGFRDHTYADYEPTADNQQSKLWFHDGSWWGVLSRLSESGDGEVTIHRLELATQIWIDTSVVVEGRKNASLDALADGSKLYVASSRGTSKESRNRAVRVSSYTYDAGAKRYTPDPGFPVDIAEGEVEAVVIDRDGVGTLWATFVQNGRVMVTHTSGAASNWVAPYVLPVGRPASVRAEPKADQSAIVRFSENRIGIMFSSQVSGLGRGVVYWATHNDNTNDRTWSLTKVFAGEKLRQINLKAVPGDSAAQVVAALKTSPRNSSRGVVVVLRLLGDGTWTSHPFNAVADNHARPVVQVDVENRTVYVLATSPCCGSEAVYVKAANLDNLSFSSGPGTRFIQSATDANIGNPTGTKQTVGSASGLLALGADGISDVYVHNYKAVAVSVPGAPPAANAPGSGPVPGAAVGSPAFSASPGTDVLPSATSGRGSVAAREPPYVERVSTLARSSPPQASYFGWFGRFIAFTGADILTLVNAAAAALLVGIGTVAAARRRRRARAPSGTGVTVQ